MATNFDTSLDVFVNPAATQSMDDPAVYHDVQHDNINDSVAALEAKVGVGGSAIATSLDYLLKNVASVDPGHKHSQAAINGLTIGDTPVFAGLTIASNTGAIIQNRTCSDTPGTYTLFYFQKSRGIQSAQTAVVSGDYVFGILAAGHDGTTLQSRAGIYSVVDAAVSAGVVPLNLVFYTGGASIQERMRITSGGYVGIGVVPGSTPSWPLEVLDRFGASDGGGADRYAVLTIAPSSGAQHGYLEAYKYGAGETGIPLAINALGGGKVGIGMLPTTYALEVNGAIQTTGIITTSGIRSIGFRDAGYRMTLGGYWNDGTDRTVGAYMQLFGATVFAAGGCFEMVMDSSSNAAAEFRVLNYPGYGYLFNVTAAGKVGIGIALPNETLEIASATGRFLTSDGGGANRYALLFVAPTAALTYGRIESYKYGTGIGGKNLAINAVGGGLVGIGVVPTTYALEVNGVTQAANFISTVATGTAPYACTSTTVNTHLNADMFDGIHAGTLNNGTIVRYNSSGTKLESGTMTEASGALGAITTLSMSGQLTNTLAIGTSPFAVTSTTVNTNLNADAVDGYHLNQGVSTSDAPAFAGLNVLSNTGVIIQNRTCSDTPGTYTLFYFQKSRGVETSQTAVVSGDYVFGILAAGHDGTALQSRAGIYSVVDAAVSAGTVPLNLIFYTGGAAIAERMRITSGGNVGISIVAPNWPLEVLDRFAASDGGGANRYALLSISPTAAAQHGYLEAYKYGAGEAGIPLAINALGGGKVGIGMVPTTNLLEVNGVIQGTRLGLGSSPGAGYLLDATTTDHMRARLSTAGTDKVAFFQVTTGSATSVQIQVYGSGYGSGFFGQSGPSLHTVYSDTINAFAIGTYTAYPLVFGTNNAERVHITSAGLVGIGKTPATYLLEVNGNIQATGYRSADGTAGLAGTTTKTAITSITVKDGLVTALAGT